MSVFWALLFLCMEYVNWIGGLSILLGWRDTLSSRWKAENCSWIKAKGSQEASWSWRPLHLINTSGTAKSAIEMGRKPRTDSGSRWNSKESLSWGGKEENEPCAHFSCDPEKLGVFLIQWGAWDGKPLDLPWPRFWKGHKNEEIVSHLVCERWSDDSEVWALKGLAPIP